MAEENGRPSSHWLMSQSVRINDKLSMMNDEFCFSCDKSASLLPECSRTHEPCVPTEDSSVARAWR